MARRRRRGDRVVLDANSFWDEVLQRQADASGLVGALASSCFVFAFNAQLLREYRELGGMPLPPTGSWGFTHFQTYRLVTSKGTRARGSEHVSLPASLGTWDPDDHHLLRIASATKAQVKVANIGATATIAAVLEVTVLDNAGACGLAQSRPPC